MALLMMLIRMLMRFMQLSLSLVAFQLKDQKERAKTILMTRASLRCTSPPSAAPLRPPRVSRPSTPRPRLDHPRSPSLATVPWRRATQ